MEIAVFIQNIQEERAEVALHIFSNPSDNGTMNGKALTERFELTDRALEEMPTWPNVRHLTTYTNSYIIFGGYSISLYSIRFYRKLFCICSYTRVRQKMKKYQQEEEQKYSSLSLHFKYNTKFSGKF